MKQGLFLFILIASLSAFTVINYEVKNTTAEVEQYQGMYLFWESKPVKEYQYLGTVKYGWGAGSAKDALIKKAKKAHPQGNALIIKIDANEVCTADVVLFKE